MATGEYGDGNNNYYNDDIVDMYFDDDGNNYNDKEGHSYQSDQPTTTSDIDKVTEIMIRLESSNKGKPYRDDNDDDEDGDDDISFDRPKKKTKKKTTTNTAANTTNTNIKAVAFIDFNEMKSTMLPNHNSTFKLKRSDEVTTTINILLFLL